MPPRRRSTPVPLDVDLARQKLADGKIVRVGISRSAQFPEGGTGRVRSIGDPTVDGEEYIQVELSLNGTKDVLPFTPADLTPAIRAGSGTSPVSEPASPHGPGAAGAAAVRRRPGRPRKNVEGKVSQLFASGAQPSAAAPSEQPAGGATTQDGDRPSVGPVLTANAAAERTRPPQAETPAVDDAPARPSRPPGHTRAPRAGKRPAPVTITVATTDSEPPTWRIEAKVGTKVALRAGAVTPARVWEMVQLLENETLSKAVGAILNEQRSAARARADALAVELAAVRAELEALPDAQL